MTQLSLPNRGASPHPLVQKIVRLRSRVRAILAMVGTGTLIAASIAVLFLLMFADYLFHIPASLRLILLLAWLAASALFAWRKLALPLTTRLTDQFLASRIENLHQGLADELISAVNFIHSKAAATNALAARHIDLAAQKTAGINFDEAVDFRPAAKSLGTAALTLLFVAVIGMANPALARVAASRWFSASGMPWPHSTHVALDWSSYGGHPPAVIPLGEKFTVRAKVDQGALPRVWLYNWAESASSTSQLMTHQKEQDSNGAYFFESALEPEGKSLSLRVDAGDDHEEPALTIPLAPRPVILDMQAQIAPPAYAYPDVTKLPKPTVINLMNQAAHATQGATIALRVRASKPFSVNDKGEPELRLLDQAKDEEIPLSMNRHLLTAGGSEAELTFLADKTLQARLVMRDKDGFENRMGGGGGGAVSIEVVPDSMPAVVITEPRRSVDRAPNGIVELTIQATDDWGFRGLKLRADKFDAKPSDPPAFEKDLPWSELTHDSAVGNTSGKSLFTWELSPLNLPAGSRLTFYAMVQDNYEVDGKQHDWVKSAPLSLSIRSDADIQEAARKSLAELTERLRSVRLQQEQTRAQTQSVQKIVSQSNTLTAAQRTDLANLSQQQSQEAATANSLEQRAAQIADDLRQNKMGEGELGKIAQEVSAGMQDVGRQNMPRAAAELNKAQESKNASASPQDPSPPSPAQQSSQSMNSAASQQSQAIATMDKLIERLGATGDFESLRQETNKILGQQQNISSRTSKLANSAAGKKADELTPEQHQTEDQLTREQRDLRDKTAELLSRMEQASQSLNQSDPASAESLQKAAASGKSDAVSQKQDSAATSVANNKLNDANTDQSAAQQALQKMANELDKNDQRKLEQLARDIRKLIEEVQKLKADEVALNKDTITAGASASSALLQKTADRQGTIQQNAVIIQKKAESNQRTAQAATFIGEASDHMVEAATVLYKNKQPDSLKPETDAIAALDLALAELNKAQQQVAPNAKDKQLAEFIQKYEQLKKDQTSIKETTDAIEARRQADPDKEFERADKLKIGQLATTQGGLIDRIDGLSKDDKLKDIEVIIWMNQQITESMTTSKTRLEKAQAGPQLANAQQTASDRIQMVIDALKEEQAAPPEFKGNNGGGGAGGGGGGGGQPPLVPPLAQLRLLKAMQVVVNGQTKSIDTNLKGASTPADKNDFQTQALQLGTKQDQIHGIADHLIQQLQQ